MKRTPRLLLSAALLTAIAACTNAPTTNVVPATAGVSRVADGSRAELALLETTDLHTNILSYDYFKLAEDKTVGFERVAARIAEARKQFANTLLFDNGDTIQGTALSDYQAQVNPLPCSETLAMYKVMNELGYDAGGIGNHEFNYGLSFLSQVTGNRFNVNLVAGEKPFRRNRARARPFRLYWPMCFRIRTGGRCSNPTSFLTAHSKPRAATASRSPSRSRSASLRSHHRKFLTGTSAG